jgi:hypothetical protein
MHFSEMHSSAHLAHLVETLVAHFKADISEDHTHQGFEPWQQRTHSLTHSLTHSTKNKPV